MPWLARAHVQSKTSLALVSGVSGALPCTPGLGNELVLAGRAAGRPGRGAAGSTRKTAGWQPSARTSTTGAGWSSAGSRRLLSADDEVPCTYKHKMILNEAAAMTFTSKDILKYQTSCHKYINVIFS